LRRNFWEGISKGAWNIHVKFRLALGLASPPVPARVIDFLAFVYRVPGFGTSFFHGLSIVAFLEKTE
jgi:hypothetical protein